MKQTVLRFGGYSALLLVGIFAVTFLFFADCTGSATQEVIGYLTILLSLVFVFAGLRHYRDRHNGGFLSFGRGLKIGLLITLLPSVGFGLFNLLYTRVINPSWRATYMKAMEAKMKPEEIAGFRRQMEAFENPLTEFALMASTVLIVGLIVTIISALALQRRPKAVLA